MEEQLVNNKKKRVIDWIKENPWTATTMATLFTLSVVEGVMMLKAYDRLGKLEKENQVLKSENLDFRGQIRANERENRRLGRELGNLNYQLGKSVASKNKQ
jgi:hypothetical protein